MTAAAPPLTAVDELAAGTSGADLVALVTDGALLADSRIRCPLTDPDDEARRRLDLALRMLRSQPRAQWCRAVGGGTDGTNGSDASHVAAVVLRWPLPARGIVLLPAAGGRAGDGAPSVLVLAVGRAGGPPDVWRFDLAATAAGHGSSDDVVDRARALLADL